MNFNFMEGFYAFCSEQSIPIENVNIESIGHGGDYKLTQQKIEAFLMRPDIGLIVAFLDIPATAQIEPIVNASGKILISADIGAHIPGLFIPSPLHISVSLQAAYSSYLGVQQAVKNNLRSFSFTSSLLDAGYTQVYTSWKVIEKANAKVNYHFTTPLKPTEINLSQLKSHVLAEASDAIILQFCASHFTEFQNEYANQGLDLSLPAIGAPFLFEKDWLSKQAILFNDLRGFVAWDSGIKSEKNVEFKNKILGYCNKDASIFHVLGWDTAIVALRALDQINSGTNPMQIAQNVLNENIESPRGALNWNKKFRRLVAPMYEVMLEKENNSQKANLTGTCINDMQLWEQFAEDVPQQYSRWNNMYLCPT